MSVTSSLHITTDYVGLETMDLPEPQDILSLIAVNVLESLRPISTFFFQVTQIKHTCSVSSWSFKGKRENVTALCEMMFMSRSYSENMSDRNW